MQNNSNTLASPQLGQNKKECQYKTNTGVHCRITSTRENSLCNYHYIQYKLLEKRNQINSLELFEAPEL
jgi:hypothetical protein